MNNLRVNPHITYSQLSGTMVPLHRGFDHRVGLLYLPSENIYIEVDPCSSNLCCSRVSCYPICKQILATSDVTPRQLAMFYLIWNWSTGVPPRPEMMLGGQRQVKMHWLAPPAQQPHQGWAGQLAGKVGCDPRVHFASPMHSWVPRRLSLWKGINESTQSGLKWQLAKGFQQSDFNKSGKDNPWCQFCASYRQLLPNESKHGLEVELGPVKNLQLFCAFGVHWPPSKAPSLWEWGQKVGSRHQPPHSQLGWGWWDDSCRPATRLGAPPPWAEWKGKGQSAFFLILSSHWNAEEPQECDTQGKFSLFSAEVALKSCQCMALP